MNQHDRCYESHGQGSTWHSFGLRIAVVFWLCIAIWTGANKFNFVNNLKKYIY
jgi:hypothetical protein